jgi:hypothetical protein
MNSLLLEIFPEAVANTIFKFCIHPLADAFILGARERLLRPFLEDLKELKTQLHEWENSEDPCKVAFKYMGTHDIDELDSFGVELKNEIKFVEPLCNKYVKRINKKRLFYYNSDDDENDDDDANEDVWYTFLKTCPYTSRPTQ